MASLPQLEEMLLEHRERTAVEESVFIFLLDSQKTKISPDMAIITGAVYPYELRGINLTFCAEFLAKN